MESGQLVRASTLHRVGSTTQTEVARLGKVPLPAEPSQPLDYLKVGTEKVLSSQTCIHVQQGILQKLSLLQTGASSCMPACHRESLLRRR